MRDLMIEHLFCINLDKRAKNRKSCCSRALQTVFLRHKTVAGVVKLIAEIVEPDYFVDSDRNRDVTVGARLKKMIEKEVEFRVIIR